MANFVKTADSATVYKEENGQLTPLGTPQAYAQATGQNPNGPINWGLVKTVDQGYLAGKSSAPVQQYSGPSLAPAPAAPVAAPRAPAPTYTPPPAINLQGIYDSLYNSPDIQAKNAKVSQVQQEQAQLDQQYATTKGKNNDNPFLSEATRVGREAKITSLYNDTYANKQKDLSNAQGAVSQAKADAGQQMELQLKQFELDTNRAQDAYAKAMDAYNIGSAEADKEYARAVDASNTQFARATALLQAGAFDNASPEDIAQLTQATGVSSSMWNSAVAANKQKNNPTSIIQSQDNAGKVTVSVIDSNGKVLNQQSLGNIGQAAKEPAGREPTEAEQLRGAISEMSSKVVSRLNSYGNIQPADWQTALAAWVGAGLKKADFVDNFGQYADLNRGDFASAYGFKNPND